MYAEFAQHKTISNHFSTLNVGCVISTPEDDDEVEPTMPPEECNFKFPIENYPVVDTEPITHTARDEAELLCWFATKVNSITSLKVSSRAYPNFLRIANKEISKRGKQLGVTNNKNWYNAVAADIWKNKSKEEKIKYRIN